MSNVNKKSLNGTETQKYVEKVVDATIASIVANKSTVQISVQDVSRVFNDDSDARVEALRDVSLDINQGEFISFIGPSGCGKTTLLRLIAGLDYPQTGILTMEDEPIGEPEYHRGYVFQ